MVGSDADPALVGRHVIDAIGYRLAELRVGKTVDADLHWCSLRPPFPAAVAEGADKLLFLRVDRDDRLAQLLEGPHPAVNAPELRVAVRMPAALNRLAAGLQAVAEGVQQPVDRALADRMAFCAESVREAARAQRRPAERAFRISARRRLEMELQRRHQARVMVGQAFAAAAGTAGPPGRRGYRRRRTMVQLAQAGADRVAGHPRRLDDPGNAAAAERAGFSRRPQAPRALVQNRFQRCVLGSNRVRHTIHGIRMARQRQIVKLFWRVSLPVESGRIYGIWRVKRDNFVCHLPIQ